MPSPLATQLTLPSVSDKSQRRLGNGLTPQAISAVMRQADLGYMNLYADLLDEARQADPHMHGVLQKRELRVAGAPREVRPGEGKGRKTQRESAAKYCQEIIDNLEVPAGSQALSFVDLLGHLTKGQYQGRSACESIWKRDGRALRPVQIESIHARRIAIAANNWKLHLWDSGATGTPFTAFPGVPFDDPEFFPPGKLIVYTPQIYGTYPTREGLGRCLVWYAAFKRWDVRDWLAFAEWAGRGLREIKYASGRDPKNPARADQADIDVAKEVVDLWSSSMSAVTADVTELKVHPPPANQEVHERLLMTCDNQISKAVLGGTLTTEAGERGARSLGDTQERGEILITVSDARRIELVIRRDLFGPAVRERFGDGVAIPTLCLQVEPKESLDALAARADKLAGRGLRIPAIWLRDQLGIPEPTDDEEVIGGNTATEAQTPAGSNQGAGEESDDSEDDN